MINSCEKKFNYEMVILSTMNNGILSETVHRSKYFEKVLNK